MYNGSVRCYDGGGGALIVRNIFRIILILILFIVLFRVMSGSTDVLTFEGFVKVLQNSPTIDITSFTSGLSSDLSFLSNIPFIGTILSIFVDLFTILMWLLQGLIQVCVYFIYFLKSFFIVRVGF